MHLSIRVFESADEAAIVALWRACGLVVPRNDPHADLRAKLRFQPELLLVACWSDRPVGTVMAGYEGHRGWINYLAVAPGYRRRGIGKALMGEAEAKLRILDCPKINLQVRRANRKVIDFYRACGFLEDDVISMGKRLA